MGEVSVAPLQYLNDLAAFEEAFASAAPHPDTADDGTSTAPHVEDGLAACG